MVPFRRAAYSLLACAIVGFLVQPAATYGCDSPTVDRRGKPLRYEAVVEQQNEAGHNLGRILYDQGRFRVEHFRRPGDTSPERIELFGDGDPTLAWSYDVSSRAAYPTMESSERALWRAVRQLGEARARQRYGIPVQVPLSPTEERASPTLGGLTLSCLRRYRLRSSGRARVAGFECVIFGARLVPRDADKVVRSHDTLQANPVQSIRAWVEPRTELVLRLEERFEFPPGSGIPPKQQVFQVKKLRLLTKVPPSRFKLPSGATAHVPHIFNHVRLPSGVKRVSMTGGFAGIGIDYTAAAQEAVRH